MSAFITTITACYSTNIQSKASLTSHDDNTPVWKPQPSRRTFSTTAIRLLLAGLILPETVSAQENGVLPDGAKQFSQVISAQRQWKSVPDAFSNGRVPEDADWENLRTYLRAVYSVSGDMDFIARGWEKARKEVGMKTISAFRTAIKAMDKPAKSRDAPAFLEAHAKVASLFDDFFNLLKQDTVGDMPAEL